MHILFIIGGLLLAALSGLVVGVLISGKLVKAILSLETRIADKTITAIRSVETNLSNKLANK